MKKLIFILFLLLSAIMAECSEIINTPFNCDSQLNINIYPNKELKENQDIELQLMRKGFIIKSWQTKSEKENNKIKININTHLDFDYPTGEYYIVSPQLNNETLCSFNIKGLYESQKKISPTAKDIKLTSTKEPIAGKEWEFSFSNSYNIKSDKLILIFEKSKDVAYFATSVNINKENVYKVQIPENIPAGDYKVLLALNKDLIETETGLSFKEINIKSSYTEATTSLKPIAYGFFKDNTNFIHTWFGNQAGTMYWNGAPWFVMTGMMCEDEVNLCMNNPQERRKYWDRFVHNIDVLASRGIKHVYVTNLALLNLYNWEFVMDFLESRGFTYTLGYPQGDETYDPWMTARAVRAKNDCAVMDKNKTGIYEKDLYSYMFEIVQNGITRIDYLVLDENMNPIKIKKADLTFDTDKRHALAKIDLTEFSKPMNVVYSMEVEGNRATSNPWLTCDYQIDYVKKTLKALEMRPGFRGFTDMILPNERGFRPGGNIFINTKEFLTDRAERLKEKYSAIENLKESWGVIGDFPTDFYRVASLYPIYSTDEKIYLTDDNNIIYTISAKSPYWTEYLDLRDISYENLQNKIVTSVKEDCDVPVFIKAVCFRELYNMNFNKNRLGVDAFGCELYHRGDALVDYGAGYRYAEKQNSKKALICATTEMNNSAMPSMYPNYQNIKSFFFDMSVTHYFGNKISYLFILDVLTDNYFEKNKMIRDERMLEWMKIWVDNLNDKKEQVENFIPYTYCSWPKSESWEEKPGPKKSVITNKDALGTSCVKAPNNVWVINSIFPFESDVTFITLHNKPATDIYKDTFENLVNNTKTTKKQVVMLGLRKDIGTLSVDKYYKNEFFEDEDYVYQELNLPKGAKILHKKDGKVWAGIVGNIQIIACEPKFAESLGDVISFAKLPKPPKDKIISFDEYLSKILNLKFATFGNDKYKVVQGTLKGKDVTYIHTSDEIGGDKIEFITPKDCVTEQNLSIVDSKSPTGELFTERKEYKKGDKIIIEFPKKINSPHVGAGRGTVQITGLKISDLKFKNMTQDKPQPVHFGGFEKSCVPEGMVLPVLPKFEKTNSIQTEGIKSVAAFNMAIDFYNRGKYLRAEEILREYIGLAQNEVFDAYCTMLGNLQLLKGAPIEAKNYLEGLAKGKPENKDLQTTYGVYVYLTDKEKAKEIWQLADTEEAKINLSVAQNNK